MAARRLIIIMVILLGISTLLAAALPDRVREAEEEQTGSQASTAATETESEPMPVANPCKKMLLQCFEVNADRREISVIPVQVGDQVVIEVASSTDDIVEIQKLGFIDVVGPGNLATFDVFADQPGRFGIKLVDAGRIFGRIEVTQRAPGESGPASAGDRP